jgi:hypothetical protein
MCEDDYVYRGNYIMVEENQTTEIKKKMDM